MKTYKTYAIEAKAFQLEDINGYIFTPKKTETSLLPTLIFYHGWTSNVERQIFRAHLLAMWGYQVVLPEVIKHGDRGSLEDESIVGMLKDFYPVIDHTISEYPKLRDFLIYSHRADAEKIAVAGHSMGGFTASGLMAHHLDIACGISFNGSACWQQSVKESLDLYLEHGDEDTFFEEGESYQTDPYDLIDNFKNRPFLMTNGALDQTVSAQGNELFYQKASEIYEDQDRIQHKILEETGHIVSDEMLHMLVSFLHQYMLSQIDRPSVI